MTDRPTPPAELAITRPAELDEGHYADFVSVWHSRTSFVLDFLSMSAPPERVTREDGSEVALNRARVVSRVRLPPEQIFELMKALERQLSAWEQDRGRQAGDR
jgi:hypothetical protein